MKVDVKTGSIAKGKVADLFVVGFEERRALLFHEPMNGGPLPSEMADEELHARLRSEEASVVYGWEPYMCNPKLRRRLQSAARWMPRRRSENRSARIRWGCEAFQRS